MSTTNIVPPFSVFTDSAGAPLDNGFVYVGTANLNPVSNPIAVYWDAALTVVAAQPLRTINGFLSQSGSPGTLFSAVDYSITVKDSKGVQVFTAPSGARAGLGSIVLAATESLTAQAGASIVLADGSTMTVGTATGTGVTVTLASNARIVGDVLPNVTSTQSLGSSARRWDANLDVATVALVDATTVNGATVAGYSDTTVAATAIATVAMNQQKNIVAMGQISSAGAISTNHYNVASTAVVVNPGRRRVTFDQAVEDDAIVDAGSIAATFGIDAKGEIEAGGASMLVDQFNAAGVLTDLNFWFVVYGRPRGGVTKP
jgi:hypothetical protein